MAEDDSQESGRIGGRRLPLRELALALASLLLALVLAEGVFRAAGVSLGTQYINRRTVERRADPKLLFGLRPNSVARAEVSYEINDQGMRNPPIPVEKPPGTTRIAVIGDSIAFGYWVEEEDGFPRQLEGLLRGAESSGERIEVLNFGVPGYNLAQEVALLRQEVLRFQPDLVLVAFCLNDLEGVFSYEYGLVVDREERRGTFARGALAFLLDHSVLASWLDYRLTELAVRRRFAERRGPRQPASGSPELRARARAELARGLGELGSVLREAGGIRGLVVVFPTFDYAPARTPHAWLHGLVAEQARAADLGALDLRSCLGRYDLEALRLDPIHPSPLGHRVAAHAVADALAAGGWLPRLALAGSGLGDCGRYRAEDFPRPRAR